MDDFKVKDDTACRHVRPIVNRPDVAAMTANGGESDYETTPEKPYTENEQNN